MATSSLQAATCDPEGREIEPSSPKSSLIRDRTVIGSTREMLKKTYLVPEYWVSYSAMAVGSHDGAMTGETGDSDPSVSFSFSIL